MASMTLVSKMIYLLVLIVSLASRTNQRRPNCDNNDRTRKEQTSRTKSILDSIGYIADDHYVKVQNGKFWLNVVRVTNPLINNGESGLDNKDPLLFIHGLFGGSSGFVLPYQGIEPKNFSDMDVNKMSIEELIDSVGQEPASKSLVFTALNFGHEVWLLNRRATVESFTANGLSMRDLAIDGIISDDTDYGDIDDDLSLVDDTMRNRYRDYWKFSLDEQVLYDLPETIDYILNWTYREKVIPVGHSAGGGLIMLALANEPELATKSWLSKRIGFLPPNEVQEIQMRLIERICKSGHGIILQCYPLLDGYMGTGSSDCMVELLTSETDWFQAASFYETAQLLQAIRDKTMHYYDYMDSSKNKQIYGSAKPPEYNISRVTSANIHIWVGKDDALVTKEDVDSVEKRMNVRVKRTDLGGQDLYFNHLAFLAHKDIQRHLILPGLKVISSN